MDPVDSRRFFVELASLLDRAESGAAHRLLESHPLKEALRVAATKAEELHAQLAAAHERIGAIHQEQGRLIAQAMLDVQACAEGLLGAASEKAEEVIGAAESMGDQTIQAAQGTAGEILRDARQRAEEAVAAAERVAAQRVAAVHADADRMVQEVHQRVAEIEGAAERHVAELIGAVEAFAPQQDRILVDLEALATECAGLVQRITRLQTEGQEKVLPMLHQSLQVLRGGGGLQQPPPATGQEPEAPASTAAAPPAGVDHGSRASDGPPDAAGRAPVIKHGEIILQHATEQEAKAFADAVSRLKGVRTALLENIYHDARVATIEVLTEGQPVNELDMSLLLDEFQIEVIGATGAMLTLRVIKRRSDPFGVDTGRVE